MLLLGGSIVVLVELLTTIWCRVGVVVTEGVDVGGGADVVAFGSNAVVELVR